MDSRFFITLVPRPSRFLKTEPEPKRKPPAIISLEHVESSINRFSTVYPESPTVVVVPFLTLVILHPNSSQVIASKDSYLNGKEIRAKLVKTVPEICTCSKRFFACKSFIPKTSEAIVPAKGCGLIEFIIIPNHDLPLCPRVEHQFPVPRHSIIKTPIRSYVTI